MKLVGSVGLIIVTLLGIYGAVCDARRGDRFEACGCVLVSMLAAAWAWIILQAI
jgi:hypothetical protein